MIFIDTWAWLALAYSKDPYHATASRQHAMFAAQSRLYVTTDYVLVESFSSMFGLLDFTKAKAFADQMLASFRSGAQRLVHVSPDQFRRAYDLRVRLHDKPDISFVDLTSMVVMEDLGIIDVFTGDAHFQKVNMGFRLHP